MRVNTLSLDLRHGSQAMEPLGARLLTCEGGGQSIVLRVDSISVGQRDCHTSRAYNLCFGTRYWHRERSPKSKDPRCVLSAKWQALSRLEPNAGGEAARCGPRGLEPPAVLKRF